MATAVLHNFLISSELDLDDGKRQYKLNGNGEDHEPNDDENADLNYPVQQDFNGLQIRETLTKYFVSPAGSVPWQ